MKKLILITGFMFVSLTLTNAQGKRPVNDTIPKKKDVIVEVKKGANPDVYIDGVKYDNAILELLDADKIESISVVKGKDALKEYNSTNGVVVIKTKKKEQNPEQIMIRGYGTSTNKQPMIIIDGEKSDQESLSNLSPDEIESIQVLKDEKALKDYNAPDGVIIIKTKKKK